MNNNKSINFIGDINFERGDNNDEDLNSHGGTRAQELIQLQIVKMERTYNVEAF